MLIYYKDIAGRTISLDVEPNDPIENVKAKIQDLTGADPFDLTLFYGGQEMANDGKTLAEYGVVANTLIKSNMMEPRMK